MTNSIRTLLRQLLRQGAEVIEVSGEPVYAPHDQSVPVPDKAQWLIQLRAFRVLARGLVREDPLQLDPLALADGVLVQAVDLMYPTRWPVLMPS